MRIAALVIIGFFVASPSFSAALDPLEAIQQNIESGIRVLEDPQYEDDSRKQEQQQILYKIMQQTYDFQEFSKRVLGSYWYKFSQRQRDEFVTVFSEFLGKFYLGKVQDRYNGQRVNYLSQQLLSDTKALVEIEVIWQKLKVPVKMRLTKRSGKWKVYDLSVVGINAVSNYRAQLKSMLKRESPQQIIGRLKDKIAKLEEES